MFTRRRPACTPLTLALGAIIVSSLGGCAQPSAALDGPRTPIINRANSPVWRGGPGNAAVFQTPQVEQQLPGDWLAELPEASRRDADLSASRPGPMLATSQWPEPPAPSLNDRRYLYLPSEANQYLYLDPDGSNAGRYWYERRWYWHAR